MNNKIKILIVDDMPINIQVLAGFLKSEYHVKIAVDGNKAIEMANSENPPELILLDVIMPAPDGFEVCRILKSSDKTKHIPIIFITAKKDEKDEAKGLKLGAADYISKPFKPAIVKARIKTQLELKHSNDSLKQALKEVNNLKTHNTICQDCMTKLCTDCRLKMLKKIDKS
ncbi:Signal transduction response regulator, receiver domain-containing protein [Desulfonema limicola]|uniref:Signal transduction response regulator, receiver domain-containing protein n=1 Tax=Desulfonema limicola TaxID=45656 RepID=A0A975BCL8_9BACT|nr:response regulator [Desulfonema limicola]QTA82835.1 Signal transduction response regulator, receiver domain-containing protein [Desulfonema limicola]